jgi:hypothetical protein
MTTLDVQPSVDDALKHTPPTERKKLRIGNMPKLIGISGVSRVGKDSFFQGLKAAYPNVNFGRLSVGDIIRKDVADFVFEATGIDVFDCTDEEKEITRPVLVWYGNVKRKQTQGRYFIDLLEEKRKEYAVLTDVDVLAVTDVRFCEYQYDEVHWIKENGFLIHLTRVLPDGRMLPPNNILESTNNELLKNAATYALHLPTFTGDVKVVKEELVKYIRSLELL